MLKNTMVDRLNKQINLEFFSSNLYLQMSAWCDSKGFDGAAKFLSLHAEEEQMHMRRLFNYVKETGAVPMIGAIEAPQAEFTSLIEVFKETLKHEQLVTESINELVGFAFENKDFSTFNFLQWYVAEQHEELDLFNKINDLASLLSDDKKGLYFFNKELMEMSKTKTIEALPEE